MPDDQAHDEGASVLDAALERISAPSPAEIAIPADVTGQLADLVAWWQALAPGQPVVPATLLPTEAVARSVPHDALADGIQAADRAADSGHTVLVPRVGVRQDRAARAIIALLTRKESSVVLPQPPGVTDREWMAECSAIRDLVRGVAGLRAEPVALLDELGTPEIAYVAGVLLGAAARRTPCLIDGTDEHAAALVAHRLGFRSVGWWRAGATSSDPARSAAADRLDLAPGLPLDVDDDAGRGARATLVLLADVTSASDRPTA